MGGESNKKLQIENIKKYIMEMLKRSKEGTDPTKEELSVILSNIDGMDHHDHVRTDQILTRKMNKTDNEYQWGSVIMNCKWKMI